jgi:hypothetical protein
MEKKSFYFSEIVLATVEETSFKGDLRKLFRCGKIPVNKFCRNQESYSFNDLLKQLSLHHFFNKILFFRSNKTRIFHAKLSFNLGFATMDPQKILSLEQC